MGRQKHTCSSRPSCLGKGTFYSYVHPEMRTKELRPNAEESQGSGVEEQGNAGEGKRSPGPAGAIIGAAAERDRKTEGLWAAEKGCVEESRAALLVCEIFCTLHLLMKSWGSGERHRGCKALNINIHILRFDNLKTWG